MYKTPTNDWCFRLVSAMLSLNGVNIRVLLVKAFSYSIVHMFRDHPSEYGKGLLVCSGAV